MTYVSWAALYEGTTDQAYFELLIPRVMEDIVMRFGTGHSTIPPSPSIRIKRESVEKVAQEVCEAKEGFLLVFIHADTGGRDLAASLEQRSVGYCEAIHMLCKWPPVRCIPISPRHETEAWVLADPQAVTDSLGYRGSPGSIGLPISAREAERIADPKAILAGAIAQVRGRRRTLDVKQIFPAIAQRQSLVAIRQSRSFLLFEKALLAALQDIGCL